MTSQLTFHQSPHLHEDFADDDVVVVLEHRAEDHRDPVLLGLHVPETERGAEDQDQVPPPPRPPGQDLHGLVISVVHHGPLLALLAFLLELEVLLEHGGEAVPLQHAGLVDGLVSERRQSFQVVEQRHVVACRTGPEPARDGSTRSAATALMKLF